MRTHVAAYPICIYVYRVEHCLLSGLLHDEPLHGIYLCCASSLGLLGVDWLLYKKATTPIWYAHRMSVFSLHCTLDIA